MKRAKGITILAWFIIVCSFFGLSMYIALIALKMDVKVVGKLILLISFVSIYTAVNLLKQKEWARKLIIYIAIIMALISIFTSVQGINREMKTPDEDYLKSLKNLQEKYPLPDRKFSDEQLKEMLSMARQAGIRSNIFNLLVQLGFNLVILIYFTRPKVKGQFK